MPLTAPCDGDAMQWCHADSAALVEQGYVADCLTQHASNLTINCWALVSLSDQQQQRQAVTAENAHYNERLSAELLSQIMADVNEKLSSREQHLLERMDRTVFERVRSHLEGDADRIKALASSGSTAAWFAALGGATAGMAAVAFLVVRRRRTTVFKDGSA